MSFAVLLAKLNDWLFKPASPTPIALVRILVGLIVLQNLVVHLLPDFGLYYGSRPIVGIDAIISKYWVEQPFFDMMLVLPPGETWRFLFFVGLIVAALFMTIGLWSRTSMVLVFLGLLSIDNHFELNQNDGDVFLKIACMILACSNAGDAFSFDNLLGAFREDWRITGFRPVLSAPWAQRWYQLQLAFVYAHTFICKVSGKHWIDGWAVYFASRYDDCQRFMLPVIFDNPFILKCLTWGTLLIEFSLCTLVWFKEFRYWVLLGGLCLHAGIEFTMNLPMFEWLFMSSYFAFVEPEDLSKAMDSIKSKIHAYFGQPTVLAFDGKSITSVRAVGVLHRMDVFGFLELLDSRNMASPELKQAGQLFLQSKGSWLTGFDAFRWMTLRLPLLWLVSPFVFVPPISWGAKLVYQWLAHRSYLLFGKAEPETLLPEPVLVK
jgi:hypothetical protein